MAETKNVSEVGIIGQMYEERKSKKVGVLESREPKYKTLMFRDKDGGTFNITYSTFKSNWRKYQGEEVITTSTQKEEARQDAEVETKKRENKDKAAKKELSEVSEKPKITRADKMKMATALKTIIENAVNGTIPDARVSKTTKGSVKVYYKNRILMGAYVRPLENRYTFDTTTEIANMIQHPGIEVEKLVNESWRVSTRFRFSEDDLTDMLNIFVSVLTGYVIDKYIKPEEEKKKAKEEKKKAEENETKEKEEE